MLAPCKHCGTDGAARRPYKLKCTWSEPPGILSFLSEIIMATQKKTVDFILSKLRHPKRFSARAMFGE